MKNKVVNLEDYKKYRPMKKRIRAVKKIYKNMINKLKKMFIND